LQPMKSLHKWNLSPSAAMAVQQRLRGLVRTSPMRKRPAIVAGMDCAFSTDGRTIVACVVVLERAAGKHPAVVETRTARRKVRFPYVPGLLSFREAPVCLAAAAMLRRRPDVFMIDGQGIAHPRRLGLAAHLGLLLDSPAIGCAKSRLVGDYRQPAAKKGSWTRLTHRGELIGAVLRTRDDVKPVFVSVGNKCSLSEAVGIVLEWTTRYRLPEPTRLAHILVTEAKIRQAKLRTKNVVDSSQ